MAQVYKFWRVERSKEDVKRVSEEQPVPSEELEQGPASADAAAGPAAPEPPDAPGAEDVDANQARSSKEAHAKLIRSLKQMQTQRHTLDILADVLSDVRIKLYAEALLVPDSQRVAQGKVSLPQCSLQSSATNLGCGTRSVVLLKNTTGRLRFSRKLASPGNLQLACRMGSGLHPSPGLWRP